MVQNPFPDEFEHSVRNCLSHLFEFMPLQNDPISEQLAPHLTGLDRIQVVRKQIIDAIEHLRQRNSQTRKSKQGRIFSLLTLRYVEGLSSQDVMQRLAISERQYYRDHRRAITALSHLLWEQMPVEKDRNSTKPISVKSEVERLAGMRTGNSASIDSILQGAVTAVANLAAHYNINISLHHSDMLCPHVSPFMILRQTVIWLLSQMITQSKAGANLDVRVEGNCAHYELTFVCFPQDTTTLMRQIDTHTTFAHLCQTLNASVKQTLEQGHVKVELTLAADGKTILIVDDNPDAIGLLRRYIAMQSYEVQVADNATDGVQLAREIHPALIILDIMLPDQDGWETLQQLKNHPETCDIPVLVCSVLDTPELALSLGADGYLQKPPGRPEFVKALAKYLA